ncbi:MAG: HD domain-containing protein [Candidatus Woesearchaeota archaeon]
MKLITRKHKEDREQVLKLSGFLSEEYALSSETQGRRNPEERVSQWRTEYERDYDRIIYSEAFRRLRNKTQVVLMPLDQLLTTRMTHSYEVLQVALRNCSHLGLNETLAAAIALGHDLGHIPFGHAGESALTKIMKDLLHDPSYEFHHARYGLDIVDRVEKGGRGLNLTEEVRDGILKHSLGASGLDKDMDLPITYEGKVVRLADKLAYTCSDLEDALRLEMIRESDIPQAEFKLLGPRKSKWIGSLNRNFVEMSIAEGDICLKGDHLDAFEVLRSFMYKNVYGGGKLKAEFKKAKRMIELVFDHVMENRFSDLDQKEAAYKTLDVVAGMTDQSLLTYFQEEFVPQRVY